MSQENEMNSGMNELVKAIHADRKERSAGIQRKREKILELQKTVGKFRNLIKGNSILENTNELIALADVASRSIQTAVVGSDALEERMKRQSLNIVVVGQARQGKSQMLQMLSGVSSSLIPTGDTVICTAAQSRIVNDKSSKSITIHFLTKQKFLEKKVWPYYEASRSSVSIAHLSPCPSSLDEFTDGLPALPETATSSEQEWYNRLKQTQNALKNRPDIVNSYLNGGIREIVLEKDLKPYVTQDPKNPLYLAVDFVEIHTEFPNDIPEGTTLIDLPGLGEMAANIEENMKSTIRNEADIVLMMKLPNINGADWLQPDFEVIDLMKPLFPGIDSKAWLTVILNEDTRSNSCNTPQVEAVLEKKPEGLTVIRCDCGSTAKVADMLKENLQSLLRKTQMIDRVWTEDFDKKYQSVKDKVDELYRAALQNKASIAEDFDYDSHMDEFLAELKGPIAGDQKDFFEQLSIQLRNYSDKQLDKIYDQLDAQYTAVHDTGIKNEKFPIFSKGELETKLRASEWGGVIEAAAKQQQWAIITLVRHHFKTVLHDELNQLYLSALLKKMDEEGAISKIIGQKLSVDSRDVKEQFRALQRGLCRDMPGVKELNSALDSLLSVEISADGSILPYLVQNETFKLFDHGDTDQDGVELLIQMIGRYERKAESAEFAKIIFDKFQTLTKKTFDELKENHDINEHISRILLANAKMFILQFYFGEKVKAEWKKLIRVRADRLWPEEYEKAMKQSSFGKEYISVLNELEKWDTESK